MSSGVTGRQLGPSTGSREAGTGREPTRSPLAAGAGRQTWEHGQIGFLRPPLGVLQCRAGSLPRLPRLILTSQSCP